MQFVRGALASFLRGLDLPVAFDAGERARACAAKSPAGAVRL